MALDLTTGIGFGAADLFASAMSLASNFWPFLMAGLAFVLGPWIYNVIVSAVLAARFTHGWNKYDAQHFGNRISFGDEFKKVYNLRKNGEYF